MIGGRRVLGVIPARGGSKGLPGKNILPVDGRPLLAWTAEAALHARRIDQVVVTSDDEAILMAGRALGCETLRRPPDLASDTATTIDVVLHALDSIPGNDIVILLQPTSPLRNADDIDSASEHFERSGASSCVSVSLAEQSPYWMYRIGEGAALEPVIAKPSKATRRQDLPEIYALNGAIYIADVAWLRVTREFVGDRTVAYIMPASRSIDIDTAADFDTFRKTVSEICK